MLRNLYARLVLSLCLLLSLCALLPTVGAGAGPAAATEAQGLRCTPRTLYRGETLSVSLPEQHGGYLALVNPRGGYMFLTSDETQEADRSAGVSPLITRQDFESMRELRLSTTSARARDYNRKGARSMGRVLPVFRQTGWYRVLVSRNSFEQEEPAYDASCRVYYVNRRRAGR